jgi:hypothetical protein
MERTQYACYANGCEAALVFLAAKYPAKRLFLAEAARVVVRDIRGHRWTRRVHPCAAAWEGLRTPRRCRDRDRLARQSRAQHPLAAQGLGLEGQVLSDRAPLDGLIRNALEDYAPQAHYMRAITRGGLGTVLNELALDAGL